MIRALLDCGLDANPCRYTKPSGPEQEGSIGGTTEFPCPMATASACSRAWRTSSARRDRSTPSQASHPVRISSIFAAAFARSCYDL